MNSESGIINENYRVITIDQPYASLLAYGIKLNETRPRHTSHTHEKGKYLINASKRWNNKLSKLCLTYPFYESLKNIAYNIREFRNIISIDDLDFGIHIINNEFILPFGCIVGSFEVKECLTAVDDREASGNIFLCDKYGLQ